jgi:uncharacterized protein
MSQDIFEAIKTHDTNHLAKLLSSGINPNIIDTNFPQWTPLHEAIDQLEDGGSIEAIVLLIRHGASIDAWDGEHDATPLLMAVFRNQIEAVNLLLAVGADPNVIGSEGDSPLRWCIEHRYYEMAAILLHCGATKTIDRASGASGMTALGIAASILDVRTIEMLLQAGANPEALDIDKCTAYQRLPKYDSVEDKNLWSIAENLLRGKNT